MFTYDKQGTVFAMREGAELLAHDGPSEGPLWRQMLDSDIVGLGADSTRIGAVTESGMVSWYAARTGTVDHHATLEAPVERAVVDPKRQRVVAASTDKIVALDGNHVTELAAHGATALALHPDGTVLAAAPNHELVTFALDGARTAKPFPHGEIRALAWHPAGFWVAGVGERLYRWDGNEAAHITSLPKGSQIKSLACHERAIAIVWDRGRVATIGWPSRDTLASLHYLEREAQAVDFGPWPWLGISLDLGDGNKHNVENWQQLNRSDTHPGRQHHSWLVETNGAAKPAAAPARAKQSSSSMKLVLPALVAIAVVLYALLH